MLVGGSLFGAAAGQSATPVVPPASVPAASAAAWSGGTIRGFVKAGNVPLPGVAVTATNTLTGKKYVTTTDINGVYEMTIPKAGRYVVRAELAAFAPVTSEVRLTAEAANQTAPFALELASRAAAQQAATTERGASAIASAIGRGTQALSMSGASDGLTDASSGSGNAGVAMPTLAGLGDAAGTADSVTVSGQMGSVNGLAGMSEDQIRERVEDAMSRARQQGGAAADQMNAVVGMLGNIMGGGFGGPGGGGRGGGGGGRGGGGGFRGFNPTEPHGSVMYQGGFPALQAQQSSVAALYALSTDTPYETTQPYLGSQQNKFTVSYTGSPYLPGLTKPSSKQFVFFTVTGQRNITPDNFAGTVPSALERAGDFSESLQTVNGVRTAPTLYDPMTGNLTQPSAGQSCAAVTAGTAASCAGLVVPMSEITPQAQALLNYYPLPNVAGVTTNNYQTITTAGNNSLIGSARFVRNFGSQPLFGGGRRQQNGPKTLRQNVNANFSFSHTASDNRNIIPLLGGKTSGDGYNLGAGYTVGYGRLTNNASVTWNRSSSLVTNYFTGTAIDPAAAAGISVPSQGAELAAHGFYNGIPNISLTNYTSLSEQTPRDAINQTISFSDFVSYSHKKHNMRFGTDIRRVHADQVGGNNVVGSFVFSGLVTESPQQQACTLQNATCSTTQASTGSSLADFLLGQPQETKIQAGLYKTYLRANVFDAYAQDDYRILPGVTLNYGLRYEYFSPYIEKNNRLVNLDHNADFTEVDPVQPGQSGTYGGKYPRSLVNPDRDMFSPRFGLAWRPKFVKDTVIRGGYGINYNTGQFATFAQSLAFQPPFAVTQNNTLATASNDTGCDITTPGNLTNMTLANGFGCSNKAVTNTYAVNKNYRLGHVQIYNVDIQKTFPLGIVVNAGFNGSKGGNLDIVTAPNASASTVTTPNAQAFTYETSVAESRNNQLLISARKRLQKGISIQAVYQYGHSIDNASSIGGGSVSQVQNSKALNLEESNSSFDVRQKLTGNYVLELPFGPNRMFLSKGGLMSKALDGFSVSGDFTFATGSYNAAAELAAGGTYTLRPDRVFTEPLAGAQRIGLWFNKAAFVTPANGFGTASRNSIEGPGTVAADMSLSRTVQLGSTRSFEARLTATNAFNTVQYSSIDTTLNSATFGQVNGTASQRTVTLLARYRF